MSFPRILICILSAAGITAIISSCNSPTGSYQSFQEYKKPIYGEVAEWTTKYEGIARNPVIIVHGFLGAKLIDPKTRKNVWGNFRLSDEVTAFPPERSRMLAVPMTPGLPLQNLKSSAVVRGLMEDAMIRVFGMNV